jgi:LppP/LprE lipoprotein
MMSASRRRRWPARVAGLLGTAALLGTGAAIAVMVVPSPKEQSVVPAAPAATPTPEPKQKQKQKRRPQLTRAQRRARNAAITTLTRQGFEPVRLADYDARDELRVLLGLPATDDAGPKRAFFFVGRRFIGYDSTTPSANLRVVKTDNRSITLRYGLYEPEDRRCCPRGGYVRVRYRWDGATLEPRGEIPPPSERVPAV